MYLYLPVALTSINVFDLDSLKFWSLKVFSSLGISWLSFDNNSFSDISFWKLKVNCVLPEPCRNAPMNLMLRVIYFLHLQPMKEQC